jgi:hypothetical protein
MKKVISTRVARFLKIKRPILKINGFKKVKLSKWEKSQIFKEEMKKLRKKVPECH